MGSSKHPERPSLDRLKDLDSLPDLASQLREAKELCNHGARADMILKWILEKLTKSLEARNSSISWNLLESTLRIVSPERVALVLGSFDLLSLVRQCTETAEKGDQILLSVTNVFNVLTQLSNGPRGAALKTLLTIRGPEAAEFTGLWFDYVYRISASTEGSVSFIKNNSILDPGLKVWEMRKCGPEDHKSFAGSCLLPASRLITTLSKNDSHVSPKRDRNSDVSNCNNDYLRILESTVAKHIFLPARALFFQTASAEAGSQKRAVSEGAQVSLRDQLARLKASVLESSKQKQTTNDALPLILDIGLRCTSTPTPKLRLKEMPWVEEMFAALLDCSASGESTGDETVLIAMLSVISKRSSLSPETLRNLLNSFTTIGSKAKPTDEIIIQHVVEIDATVFIDEQLGKALCDYVTAITLREEHKSSKKKPSTENSKQQKLRTDKIVIPVMQACARDRRLLDFIELWYHQLQHDEHYKFSSVWTSLDPVFEDLMESTFTPAQVLGLFDRFYDVVKASLSKAQDYDSMSLSASFILLRNILRGARSDEVRDALYDRVSSLFEDLLKLSDQKVLTVTPENISDLTSVKDMWSLFTLVFQAWFPTWASDQPDRTSVEERGMQLLASKTARNALDYSTSVSKDSKSDIVSQAAAREANIFITSMCRAFDSCAATNKKILKEMTKNSSVFAVDSLIKFPDALGLSDESTQNKRIPRSIEDLSNNSDELGLKKLEALVASGLVRSAESVTSESITNTIVSLMKNKTNVDQGIQIMSCLRLEELTIEQRGRIADAYIDLGPVDRETPTWEATLQKRLSFLLKLVALPHPEIDLLKDSKHVWQLVVPTHTEKQLDRQKLVPVSNIREADTLKLLEQVLQSILKKLQGDRGHKRTQPILMAFAKQSAQYISLMDSSGASFSKDNLGLLSAIKVILLAVEADGNTDLTDECLKPSVVEGYLDMIVREVKQEATLETKSPHTALPALMSALLSAPWKTLGATGTEEKYVDALRKVSRSLLRNELLYDLSESTELLGESKKAILLQCFQVVCLRFSPIKKNQTITEDALKILTLEISPREHNTVLLQFHRAIKKTNIEEKATFIDELLLSEKMEAAPAALLLVREIMSTVDKSEAEDNKASLFRKSLHTVLRIAATSQDVGVCRRACDCVSLALREKPFMANQYTIEATLMTLQGLAKSNATTGIVYLDICRILTLLLQQHRSRLRDRFHLVVPLVQALISKLFQKTRRSQSGSLKDENLTDRHAHALTRAVQLLCGPPQARRHSKSSDLIDEARRAQAQVGQYIQYALHQYCSQVLTGAAGDGVRDALRPGLWAMIEAIEVNDVEGVKVLSSAMNNSERAVLRSVYEDYKAIGKWKGG